MYNNTGDYSYGSWFSRDIPGGAE